MCSCAFRTPEENNMTNTKTNRFTVLTLFLSKIGNISLGNKFYLGLILFPEGEGEGFQIL